MKRTSAMLVGVLTGLMLATPVLAAAEKVCLQHSRINGMRAFDERTIVVTDRTYKRYTVDIAPGCLGLTDGNARFVFRTFTTLSCIGPGDLIGVTTPFYGHVPCAISGVHAGVPAPAPG